MRRVSVRWRITLVAAGAVRGRARCSRRSCSCAACTTTSSASIRQHRPATARRARDAARQRHAEAQLDLAGRPTAWLPRSSCGRRRGDWSAIMPDGHVPGPRPPPQRARATTAAARLQTRQTVESPSRAGHAHRAALARRGRRHDRQHHRRAAHRRSRRSCCSSALLAWYLAGRALRPVEAIRAEAAAITGSHDPPPRPRARHRRRGRRASPCTMNEMLDRLEDAVDAPTPLRVRRVARAAQPGRGRSARSSRSRCAAPRPRRLARGRPAGARRGRAARADGRRAARARAPRRGRRRAATSPRSTSTRSCSRSAHANVRVAGRRRATSPAGGCSDGRTQLARVVRNLLDNACRHADSHGRRLARGRRRHASSSSSTTTDPGSRRRTASASSNGSRASTRAAPATPAAWGSGLAVVKATVERHGGTVTIDEAPPGGARFVVRLPAA